MTPKEPIKNDLLYKNLYKYLGPEMAKLAATKKDQEEKEKGA